jgi:hypothetical protein
MTTCRATLVLLLSTGALAVHAQDEPTLERVHSGSGGTIPIERASLLKIEGVAGTLVLRGGKPGELRYEARTLDDRRQPRAIAIDRRGPSELRLGHADPATTERLLVEVAVAPQLSLDVRAQDTRLVVTSIGGDFDVRGARLDVDVRGSYGAVTIDLDTGKVHLENSSSDVHVAGKALDVELRSVGGALGLELEKSRATVDGVAQETEAHLDETALVLSRGQGALRLEANGGSVELREPAEAVEARLEGAPLKLTGGTANVQIESDDAVEFSGLAGPLSIEGYGGTVRGMGGTGSIHVKKTDADVSLADIAGAAMIQGDGLHVRVSRAKSTVQAETVSSEITIEDVLGAVTVKNEYGDVSVARAGAGLRVDSRNGRVVAEALKGQVDVRADGDEVSVEWAELSLGGDQRVENASGPVVARLPGRATCRVEAESTYGTVRSAFPAIERTGEHSAAGNLNGGAQPVVRIKAGGDIELEVASGGAP